MLGNNINIMKKISTKKQSQFKQYFVIKIIDKIIESKIDI